ncbi:MAG: hypothetical protein ACP5NF_04865 [Thermoanaerobaculum sp.]
MAENAQKDVAYGKLASAVFDGLVAMAKSGTSPERAIVGAAMAAGAGIGSFVALLGERARSEKVKSTVLEAFSAGYERGTTVTMEVTSAEEA